MNTSSGTATFLCTDLAPPPSDGSPPSDEALESSQRAHFRILREVLGSEGPAVKNLGNALVVVFTSAVEAVEVALEMQSAVSRHNRNPAGAPLRVRVGLHVGEPVRDEEDYFGGALMTTRRVCQAAQPGQLLVSELVQRLVGSRGGFHFHRRDAVEAPGVASIVTYEVEPRPEDAANVPLPATLQQWRGSPFVGREGDFQSAIDAYQRSRAGGLQVLLLTGEPGIGKTRLAAELGERASRDGAMVLYGRCVQELSQPYRPFVESLEHYFAGGSPPELRRRLGQAIYELARVVPALEHTTGTPPPPARDAEEARYRLFDAFAACFRELSQRQPTVLVLDDLHWADRASLQLLLFIARQVKDAPMLVLATYRETELDSRHPTVDAFAQLGRDAELTRFSLTGLEPPAVVQMVQSMTDAGLDPETKLAARALCDKTDGNPLFIEEILKHLRETGGIDSGNGHAVLRRQSIELLDVPEGVRDIIDRRTARLSENSSRLLMTAAVMGREFGVQLLELVVGLLPEDFLDAIDEAIGAGLILEVPGSPGRFAFSHALVRDALYQELSESRRTLVHRSVAETAEKLFAENLDPWLNELAHHYYEASAGGVAEKAVDFSVQAATRTQALHAYQEAAAHYRHAVSALAMVEGHDESRRCELLLDLGDVQWRAGDTSLAEVTYLEAAALARKLNQPLALARAALGTSPGFPTLRFGFHDEQRVAVLQEALDALGPEPSAARARVLAERGRALIWSTDPEDLGNRQAFCREAVAMARSLDDPETLSAVLASQHVATWDPGNAEERLAIADEIISMAGAGGERQMEMNGRMFRLIDQLELGVVARDEAQKLAEMAKESRQAIYIWFSSVWAAMLAMFEGRLEEGETLSWLALEQGQGAIEDNPEQAFSAQMFSLKALQGRLPELEAPLREMVEKRPNIPGWRAGLALLECEMGDMDAASADFDLLAAADFADFPRESTWQIAIALSSEVAYRLGDTHRAAMLYELLTPFADRNIVATYAISAYGSGARALGMLATLLGDYDAAEAHFKSAIEMNSRLGARPYVALAQADYAELLSARSTGSDQKLSDRLRSEASAAAAEIGMAGLTRRVSAVGAHPQSI